MRVEGKNRGIRECICLWLKVLSSCKTDGPKEIEKKECGANDSLFSQLDHKVVL